MQARFVRTNSNVADLITSAGLLGNSLAKVSRLSARKALCFPSASDCIWFYMLQQEQDSQAEALAATSKSARRSDVMLCMFSALSPYAQLWCHTAGSMYHAQTQQQRQPLRLY